MPRRPQDRRGARPQPRRSLAPAVTWGRRSAAVGRLQAREGRDMVGLAPEPVLTVHRGFPESLVAVPLRVQFAAAPPMHAAAAWLLGCVCKAIGACAVHSPAHANLLKPVPVAPPSTQAATYHDWRKVPAMKKKTQTGAASALCCSCLPAGCAPGSRRNPPNRRRLCARHARRCPCLPALCASCCVLLLTAADGSSMPTCPLQAHMPARCWTCSGSAPTPSASGGWPAGQWK